MSRRSVHPTLEIEYTSFRNRADPFGMADELAASRTLLIEFRESIEAQSEAKVGLFCRGVGGAIRSTVMNVVGHALGVPAEDRETHDGLSKLSKAISEGIKDDVFYLYEEVFGPVSRITPEQARVMAGLIKNVGDLAEKFKKISEGVALPVHYDQQVIEMMTKFLVMVVLPYCSMEQKAMIGEQAMKFLPQFENEFAEAIDG